jgi:hypothetical protein
MRRPQRWLPWLVLAALPLVGRAHHSTANFSAELIEFQGTLRAVDWRNPHVELTLTRDGDAGGGAAWRLISNSLYDLERAGITRDVLVVGEHVKIAGHPSTVQPHVALVTNMLRADGTEVVLRRDARAYWSEQHIGGRDHWLSAASETVDAERENRGLFRVWSASEIRASKVHSPFTERAIAARSDWNVLDNFMLRCEPPGMPQIMTAPHPYEFVDYGATITLRSAWFDRQRTIHMAAVNVAAAAASAFGYSTGYWDGRALVVETTAIDWPYFDGIGTPQSTGVRVTERFTLSADQRRLDYRAVIVDPVTLTGQATYETSWLALGETIDAYDCQASPTQEGAQ